MSGLQVLVVSADPERSRALAEALRAGGHHVGTQPDAAQAGTDLQAPALDGVVVDLRVPGVDRVQLGRALSPAVSELRPEPLEAVERRHILATLLYTGGNKRRAAGLLGIARSTLIQKVRRYGIDVPGRGQR
jgi:DNA-binding NtrC family response regulator